MPTEELKQDFLNSLDNVEEPTLPSVQDQIKGAEAQPHVSEEMYANIQKELEADQTPAVMTPEEEKAAI